MADVAIEQINDNNSQDFVRMRNTYEEMLKIAAMHLSEKTSKE